MKSRLAVLFLVVIGILVSEKAFAQQNTSLKIQPDRLKDAQQMERKAIATHDSLLLAEAYYRYGKTYSYAGDYQQAHRYFIKSLRILEPRGYSDDLSRIYFRLSNIENKQGHLREALRYGHQSFQIAQAIQSDKALIRACEGLGQAYANTWNHNPKNNPIPYDSSVFYYKKAEYLCNKLADTLGVAEVYITLGELMTNAHNPQAIPYLEKALSIFQLKHKEAISANVQSQLAILYLQAGQTELARQMLEEAEKKYTLLKTDDYDTRLGLDQRFIVYFEKTGQWEKAYKRLRMVNTLQNSLWQADHQGTITRLNLEFDTEKKEALIQAKNRETILAWTLCLAAVGMSIVFFRLNKKNKRISRQNEELVKEQNHRVKNNLQVVASLLSLQSKRLTDEGAKKAIEESRLRVQSMAIVHRRLYDGEKLGEINLEEFSRELVQGVLKSFGYATLKATFDVEPISLKVDKAVPFGLILNELVTNACKYAFPGNVHPELQIHCHRKHNKLECVVSDNGPGFDNQDATSWQSDSFPTVQRTSFGMALLDAQVTQLGGTYTFKAAEPTGSRGTVFTMAFKV